MNLRLAGDRAVAELRAQFMGVSGPTDVLSFPSEEGPEVDSRSDGLGDVIIAWRYSMRQARTRAQAGWTPEDEAIDLALHGLAHLLGSDHAKRHEARAMLRVEQRLARGARMPPPRRPYPNPQ